MSDKPNELAEKARKAYFREWRAKNRDKIKQHNANFWTKRAERIAQEAVNKNDTENN